MKELQAINKMSGNTQCSKEKKKACDRKSALDCFGWSWKGSLR